MKLQVSKLTLFISRRHTYFAHIPYSSMKNSYTDTDIYIYIYNIYIYIYMYVRIYSKCFDLIQDFQLDNRIIG